MRSLSTQPERLPTGEAFGFDPDPRTLPPDDPLLDGIESDQEIPEGEGGGGGEFETPAGPAQYEPRHAAPEPTPEQIESGEVGGEGTDEFERILFGGREFTSVDEAERSYEEMQQWASRAINDARAMNQNMGQLQAQVQQQQQLLQQIAPLITQQLMEENPELAEQMQRSQEIERLVAERVQQQIAPIAQQQQAQAEEAERRQVYDTNVDNFYRSHPEVEEGSDLDRRVGQAFVELRRTTGLNMAHPEALNVALSVVQNPKLLTIYRLNPTYLDTPEGRQYAEQMAGTPEIQTAIANGQRRTQDQAEASRRAAFVEHGGSGIPAQTPGQAPKGDEFDEALNLWKSERSENIFFQ